MSRSKAGIVLAMALVAFPACTSYELWPQTQELVGHLRCGMSKADVASIVQVYGSLEFVETHRGTEWDMVISSVKHQTGIYLDFEDGRLLKSEVIWIDGILHASTLPVRDYCQDSQDSETGTPPPPS